jgi:hypothetical protein
MATPSTAKQKIIREEKQLQSHVVKERFEKRNEDDAKPDEVVAVSPLEQWAQKDQ